MSGSICEVTKYDCFCSWDSATSFLVVDLGETMPVTTVVVTLSSYFPNYFKDVVVRVRDTAFTFGLRIEILLIVRVRQYTGLKRKVMCIKLRSEALRTPMPPRDASDVE